MYIDSGHGKGVPEADGKARRRHLLLVGRVASPLSLQVDTQIERGGEREREREGGSERETDRGREGEREICYPWDAWHRHCLYGCCCVCV